MIGGTLYALGEMVDRHARHARSSAGRCGSPRCRARSRRTASCRRSWFTAVLSINLGLINLFPIPMLDGGHLAMYGIEAARGRPLNERSQEIAFRFGLAMVLSLMVFATWNDLVHLA